MPNAKPKSAASKKSSQKAGKKAAPKKQTVTPQKSEVRKLRPPKRLWYNPLSWRNRAPLPVRKPLPKARLLFAASVRLLYKNWKLFGGICLTYGILNLVLVRGFSGSGDLSTLKEALSSVSSGFTGKVTTSLTSFVYLLSASGSSSETAGIYQSMLLIICSLAIVWALRQVLANNTVRIRDAFYQGMYPLIPFLLVFLFIGIQLLPLALGGGLYSLVISNGIAVHIWEKAIFIAIFALSALWSLRMITGSLFALYIVTLPDMTPFKALRSAKALVYGRRLLIWRKLIFLPIVLLLIAVLLLTPLILFVTPAAQWIFFALSVLALAVVHTYLYNLYRDLL